MGAPARKDLVTRDLDTRDRDIRDPRPTRLLMTERASRLALERWNRATAPARKDLDTRDLDTTDRDTRDPRDPRPTRLLMTEREVRLGPEKWTRAVRTAPARKNLRDQAPRDRNHRRRKRRRPRRKRRTKRTRNRKAKNLRNSAVNSSPRPTAQPTNAPGVFHPRRNANQPSRRKEKNQLRRKRMSAISRFVEYQRKAKGKNDLTNLNRKRNDQCFETRARYRTPYSVHGFCFHQVDVADFVSMFSK